MDLDEAGLHAHTMRATATAPAPATAVSTSSETVTTSVLTPGGAVLILDVSVPDGGQVSVACTGEGPEAKCTTALVQ
jgi:hypothetical protein